MLNNSGDLKTFINDGQPIIRRCENCKYWQMFFGQPPGNDKKKPLKVKIGKCTAYQLLFAYTHENTCNPMTMRYSLCDLHTFAEEQEYKNKLTPVDLKNCLKSKTELKNASG